MNLDEFIHQVKELSGNKFTLAESRLAIESTFEALRDIMVRHDEFLFKGFGKFGGKLKKGHIARNPKTLKEYRVPDHYIPFFVASTSLKEEVFGR